jgi:ABC-type transporter MlaC component
MAETVDQIRHHIESQRSRLIQNVNELESRLRETVDWRLQFQRHTGTVLGAAFGLGALLAWMLPGPDRDG